jgi:ATP-dependent DNA ligase
VGCAPASPPCGIGNDGFTVDQERGAGNAARGLAVFDLIRRQRHGADAVLIAFDLIELDGEDLRR